MAEPSSARLELLYRISQTINSSLDLDVVMESLMDEVIFATRAERGFLMLYDENDQLSFRTARGMNQQVLKNPNSRSHAALWSGSPKKPFRS